MKQATLQSKTDQAGLCDALLRRVRAKDSIASIHTLSASLWSMLSEDSLSEHDQKSLHEIVGAAFMMQLEFPTALKRFKRADSPLIDSLMGNALWYGRYPELVKGRVSADDYKQFLMHSALPHMHLYREGNAFVIDQEAFDTIKRELKQLGIDPKGAMVETARAMAEAGNQNLPLRLFLAYHGGAKSLTEETARAYRQRLAVERASLASKLQQHCVLSGKQFVKTMQMGDDNPLFPTASGLFLITHEGTPEVVKEHVRLYVDFSSLSGYSQEKEILEKVRHPSIVPYLGSMHIDEFELLRFGFVEGRSLSEFVRPNTILPTEQALGVVRDLAQVIHYLHEQGILYLDVKAKNIIYHEGKSPLLDFGMARMAAEPVRSLLSTPRYITPEMASTFTSYRASDVFQMGILMYELLTGEHPFARISFKEGDEYRRSELLQYGLPNLFNPVREHALIPAPCKTIIDAMLNKDHTQRPTVPEVISALEEIA